MGRGTAPSGGSVRTVTREVAPADYARIRDSLATSMAEVGSLRGRLEGVTVREPEQVLIVDTVIQVDTVLRFITVDSRGRLSYELLTQNNSALSPDSVSYNGFRPELRERVNVGDCDDGWAVARDGSVACNSARLGHLFLAATISRSPSVGAYWRKSYRSPWELAVSYDGSRVDLSVRRSFQLW